MRRPKRDRRHGSREEALLIPDMDGSAFGDYFLIFCIMLCFFRGCLQPVRGASDARNPSRRGGSRTAPTEGMISRWGLRRNTPWLECPSLNPEYARRGEKIPCRDRPQCLPECTAAGRPGCPCNEHAFPTPDDWPGYAFDSSGRPLWAAPTGGRRRSRGRLARRPIGPPVHDCIRDTRDVEKDSM